ncbi:MAG: hypothetical protein VW405_05630 [Rhodospirillaceae bacterium]
MIIGVVDIPWGAAKRTDEVLDQALESTKIYHDVKGLVRKHYINGAESGGGIYVFDTRENAEAWFHDGWADWMEGRFGVRPTLTLYDNYLTLDNEAGEVRVAGEVVPAPWADAAE